MAFRSIQDIIRQLASGKLKGVAYEGTHGNKLPQSGQQTAITTAGAGTLTAAAIASGLIKRTGPGAGYEDTTATAAQLLAIWPEAEVGDTFQFIIINGVAQANTMAAGAGVTLAGTVNNAASKVRLYQGVFTNVDTAAVTINGVGEMVA